MPRIIQYFLELLNKTLDAEYVLSFLGATHIKHCGKELRAFCPIHGSDRQRSLSVRLEDNVAMCHNTGCPLHKGGSLLWIHSLVHNCSIRESAEFWSRKTGFQLKYEEGRPQPEEFQFKEIGGISANGKFWRNRLVTASQPPTTLQTPELDTFQSALRYDNPIIQDLRKALRGEEAYVFGPAFFDFDNVFRKILNA